MYSSMKKATENSVHWTRVEAWAGAGIPDVNGAIDCGEFWVENKVVKTKSNIQTSLWRPAQIAWQSRRSCIFANVFNLVSRPSADIIEIYTCKTLAKSMVSGQWTPDLVLSAPVKWSLFIAFVQAHLADLQTPRR